jgi:hypothetical protein
MNVTVALLSALVFLPPMLVWADQRGWVSKGMLDTRHDHHDHHDPGGHHAAAEPEEVRQTADTDG